MQRNLPLRAAVLLALLLLVAASYLEAQVVRGRLVVGDPEAPVVGAYLTLADSAGVEVSTGTSSVTGRFTLRAPTGGRYLLKVARIGFPPWYYQLSLAPDENLELTLAPTGSRFVLPTVDVLGDLFCGARAREDSLSSMIWDQAHTALAVADEAFVKKQFQFLSFVESWRLTRQGKRWTKGLPGDEARTTLSAWPIKAPPPYMLQLFGFITEPDNQSIGPTWYGPDAGFLLSTDFFSSYCFQVVGPNSRPVLPWMHREVPENWIGLAFKPGRKSQRAGIAGVLWLDRASAELRRIEWVYDHVPKWASGRDAGGRIDFAALDNGGRIPQRWIMRVPIPQADYQFVRLRFAGYVEWGGYVAEVRLADGQVVARFDE